MPETSLPKFLYTASAISELRKRLGMTCESFGDLLGVDASTVCTWGRGRRHPCWKHHVAIHRLAEQHGLVEVVAAAAGVTLESPAPQPAHVIHFCVGEPAGHIQCFEVVGWK